MGARATAFGSGTDLLILQDDGNVGMGTTAPLEKLHVVGNVQLGTTGTDSKIMFSRASDGAIASNIDFTDGANLIINTTGGSSYVRLRGHTSSGGVTLADTGGNVGIGVTTPAFTLSLKDTGDFGTDTFTSALIGGDGFKIDDGGSSGTTLEIDNIVVRNTLRTHIFQKDVVKATNGYLYVSDSIVIDSTPIATQVKVRDDKSAIFSSFPITM
mgnify:FL=1